MLKKILFAALLTPLLALAQSYPSPTFNNVTSQGTATLNNATVSGTFTATGKIGLTSLAPQAANTVVGNATSSSATPTAITVAGCNGAAQALQWTNGSGFQCNSSIATSGANANITSLSGLTTPLSTAQGGTGTTSTTGTGSVVFSASPALTGTPTVPTATAGTNTTQAASTQYVQTALTGGANAASFTTIAASSTITPSQTSGIVGTTTNNSANAGSVGEYVSSTVLAGSAVAYTNGVSMNITSISLTAGDWDVWGTVAPIPGTQIQAVQGWVGTVSATAPTLPNGGGSVFLPVALTSGQGCVLPVGMMRLSLSATTTVYLGANISSTANGTVYGFIGARRRR